MKLVTITEYAKMNGVTPETIRCAIYRGKIQVIKREGRRAFVNADIPYAEMPAPKRPYGTQPRLSNIFRYMKQRCYNPKNHSYKRYGGRGITICDEWLNDTNAFIKWALENGYADNLTIDRINNDKGYCPENCQWISRKENTRKRHKDNAPKAIAKAEAKYKKLIAEDPECKKWADAYLERVKNYYK